jgi:D-alanyl-D-alanine carboxypeptidase
VGTDTWASSAGYSNLEAQTPYDPADHVRIASITKTYTATAILQMVDEGLISLDDVLSTWVPSVANAETITVHDLLAMRSGIFNYTTDEAFGVAFGAEPTMPWDLQDTLDIINAHGAVAPPDTTTAYCDSNYVILGHILEETRQAPLHDIFRTRIIEPLGLTSTAYPTSASLPDPHPTGYVPVLPDPDVTAFDNAANPPKIVDEVNPVVASTAGAITSTLADLHLWGDELVTGSLLTPATQELRLQTTRFDGQTSNIGYGLGLLNLNEYLGHNGGIFGFNSVIITRPEVDAQIAIVGNESSNSTRPTFDIALALIGQLDPSQSL